MHKALCVSTEAGVPSGTPTLSAALWWQQIRPLGWCPVHTVSHKWIETPCPTQCLICGKYPAGLWKTHGHRSVGGRDQHWHGLIVVWPGTSVLTVHGLPNCIHVCVRCTCHSGCKDCHNTRLNHRNCYGCKFWIYSMQHLNASDDILNGKQQQSWTLTPDVLRTLQAEVTALDSLSDWFLGPSGPISIGQLFLRAKLK